MHAVLLTGRHIAAETLAEQAGAIFAALSIQQHEERFSANYPPDEHYFLGHASNLSVKVCDSDDVEFPEYPYWVVLQEPVSWASGTTHVVRDPHHIAAALALAGFKVFIPSEGWGQVGWVPSGATFDGQS